MWRCGYGIVLLNGRWRGVPNLPSDIAKDQHPRRVALRTCGNHRSINAFTPMHFGYDLKGRISGSYYIRRLVWARPDADVRTGFT